MKTRRTFLKGTLAAASSTLPLFNISGTKASGQIIGANERIRIGVCGIKGRGGSHIAGYMEQDNVEVATLIDVDSTQFAPRQRQIRDKTEKEAPNTVADIRQALEDKDIDAVSIATCNHTHSLYAVWACQAGKNVYVEKPMSHNIFEGRKVVEAAKKYKRIVQHGTQQRSSESRAKEIAAVKSGKYGKLVVSKGYCCKPRWSIGMKEAKDPPPNLNFDLWLGPAPLQPYHENLVHYNWHWFWDFGSGDTGNQGVHEIDVARWAIDGATLPNKAWSLGGRLGYKDQGQTPNMHMSVLEYDDVLLIFETRGLVHDKYKDKGFDRQVLNEYYTTDGVIRNGKFYPKGSDKGEPVSGGTPDKITPGGPFGSFIAAVRSGNPEVCNAGPEHGHYSSALCHLGNITYRVGKQQSFGGEKPKRLGDDPRLAASFEKIESNLEAVGMNLSETNYDISPILDFDSAAERFRDSETANQLLSRDYREPYVVPEVV